MSKARIRSKNLAYLVSVSRQTRVVNQLPVSNAKLRNDNVTRKAVERGDVARVLALASHLTASEIIAKMGYTPELARLVETTLEAWSLLK